MNTRLITLLILSTSCSGNQFSSNDALESTGGSSTITTTIGTHIATGGQPSYSSTVPTGGANATTGGETSYPSTVPTTTTGGNSTVTTTNTNPTVIDGVTIHSDMSGYTNTCLDPSQQVITCMHTFALTGTPYKYCTTLLSEPCTWASYQALNPIYQCWSC